MKYFFLLLGLTISLTSCKDSKNKAVSAFEKQRLANNHPGKKLMETYCYSCHTPTGSHENRIAPPMIAIKRHYINDNTSKAEFIDAMQNWIKNPTKENAKMYGAVNRFGLMPKTPYPEESIKQIADYMYDFELEAPEWFESHYNEECDNCEKNKLKVKNN